MTPNAVIAAMIIIICLGLVIYYLGYEAGTTDVRQIKKNLSGQLRLAHKQKTELTSWVRENWPNEYAAYRRGIDEGYQQGVDHAPQLSEDPERP